jgi:hypothetical protein
MTTSFQAANRLVDMTEDLLRTLDHPALGDFLGRLPETRVAREVTPTALPVLGWGSELVGHAGPATRALTAALVEASGRLEWRQTYKEADFGADFLTRYGYTELIGLRGPVASEHIAAGFLFLGPGCDYPDHSHEAEELYLPLAGTAEWSQGGQPRRPRIPGEVIFHRSWEAHSMHTATAPLLALYLWRDGDLAQKSKIL